MNLRNYYDGNNMQAIEKAELAEDITFKSFEEVVEGKFFIKIMTPGNKIGYDEPKIVNRGGFKQSNFVTLKIPASVLLNCTKPTIRTLYIDANGVVNINNGRPIRLLTMDFENAKSTSYTIPKGTEFLVECISGSTTISDYRIVGTSEPNPQVLEV